MNQDELLGIIKQAQQEQWTTLDLSENGIEALPPEIGNLTSLSALFLDGNQLAELPPEIGNLTSLTRLYLGRNQIAVLPPEIGNLANLLDLYLAGNQIAELPPEIGKMASLSSLFLDRNQIAELPPEIGNLTSLSALYLTGNQLAELAPEIGKMASLSSLFLDRNQIAELPPEIGNLTSLSALFLDRNQIAELPTEIGNLTSLSALYLGGNQLAVLPPEIGKLDKLESLSLDGMPGLRFPPPDVVARGAKAVVAFMREWRKRAGRSWVSKMLIVGEGGVGKTSLLKALRGEDHDPNEPTTHGIQIRELDLDHPEMEQTRMRLNCWDFGGQQIYHATHKFFLTGRSLYILVWNSRFEWEQGKIGYWLETIKAQAPGSPVLIVATNIDERTPSMPEHEFEKRFPQIKGFFKVDNESRRGLEELVPAIARVAAGLPLMGEEYPSAWLDAAAELDGLDEKHIDPERLFDILGDLGVAAEDQAVASQWLHDIGYILYYGDDDKLRDKVFLDPEWVSTHICKVLDSEQVKKKSGVLTQEHMQELWSKIPGPIRAMFLNLMQKFDLSYEIQDPKDASLIVENLPQDPPSDLEEKWERPRQVEGCKELRIKYELSVIPPGIPTWFIARAHRFTTYTHWRYGALFADGKGNQALLRSASTGNTVELTVRGPFPHVFLDLLGDGLEYTLERYPGLEYKKMIPCPGHIGEECPWEFDYAHLEKAISKNARHIQCLDSLESVSVAGLLFGIHESSMTAIEARLESVPEHQKNNETAANLELVQRHILKAMQSESESYCPGIFVLRPADRKSSLSNVFKQEMELQLYCEMPGEWHPVGEPYPLGKRSDWLHALAPHIRTVTRYMGFAVFMTPLMKGFEAVIKADIVWMKALAGAIGSAADDRARRLETPEGHEDLRARGAQLRALCKILEEIDLFQRWGGLRKHLTPEGEYFWLCEEHIKEYEKKV